MASLLDNLITVLDKENEEYKLLVELADKKTPFIVKGDIEGLGKITEDEKEIVGRIQRLEKTRTEVLADIANVVNRDVTKLKLRNLIQMLEKQPVEQKKLAGIKEELGTTITTLRKINEKNQTLLKDAMDMVSFDLNMIRALKAAPQTANYTKRAFTVGSELGVAVGAFDARS